MKDKRPELNRYKSRALHTDTPRPPYSSDGAGRGLDRKRFDPRPVQLNHFRERFAREWRALGVAAEATPTRARGQGIAGSSMTLVKLRARLRTGGSSQMTGSDRRANQQAIAVVHGQAELPAFIGKGKTRWQEIRHAYSRAAAALDSTGQSEDRALASDVRGFLDKHPDVNATPEIFAARHSRNLQATQPRPEPPAPEPPPIERGPRR